MKLQSTAAYSTDGDHVTRVRNANNQLVEYAYNTADERLTSSTVKVTDSSGQEVIHSTSAYTYDNAGRITGTTLSNASSELASIGYSYPDGLLSSLVRTSTDGDTSQSQTYNFTYNAWGQSDAVKVGSTTLASYEYENIGSSDDGGGNLTKMTYGNGASVDYSYDSLDRLIKKTYNDTGSYVEYAYNSEGALARVSSYDSDNALLAAYVFEYDGLGRLIRSAEYDGDNALVQRTEHIYDACNRLSSQSWVIGNTSYSESYTYDDGASGDGSLTKMTTATGDTLNYTYDALKRLNNVTTKNASGTALFSTSYAFKNLSTTDGITQTTTQVQYRNVRIGTSGTILEGKKYVYDALGNITEIRQSTSPYNLLAAYEYDNQNQLISEVYYNSSGSANTNITQAYYYTYDTAGNLLKVEEGTVNSGGTITKTTVQTYTYGNTQWRDLLTAVNGNTIIYEGQTYNESTGEVEGTATSGNPTFYRNGTDVYYDMSWANGRQLTFVECYYGSQSRSYFTYDANGIRVRKNVETPGDSPTFTYVTQNGKVVRETMTERYDPKVLDYTYDESGRPFAVTYQNGNATPVTYYYILNLQGDVIGLVNASGAVVARYSYNAWGELLSVTNASGQEITDDYHIANLNHLRYRGYYYDYETGFYYLQSRYYDPANHRFINADSYASTGQGFVGTNMFAYCNNNPANLSDPSGHESSSALDFDGNGVPDYLDKRWREQTDIVKMHFALRDMGFADSSYRSAKQCLQALSIAGIDTAEEKAHFFSQCRVESSLSLLEAGWLDFESAEAYRKEQEYYPYYGAGYIQLTWSDNYKAFSEYMADPRIYSEGPTYVAENYAWLSAGWFWMDNNINRIIDTDGSVFAVTKAINGGTSQFDERMYYYITYLDYWGG